MKKKTLIALFALVFTAGLTYLVAQVAMPLRDSSLVSYVYDNFEEDPASTYDLVTSPAAIKDKCQMKLYENTPVGLGEWRGQSTKSLGINASFARKGFNWIELVPKKFKPFEGKTKSLSVWIWGGNFAWDIDFVLEDYLGFQWAIPGGSIQHYGWRNVSVIIPGSVPQEEPYIPRRRGLSLKKFRIYSNPNEIASRFHVFFDFLQVVTDSFKGVYDGMDLEQNLRKELYGDLINQGGQQGSPAKK